MSDSNETERLARALAERDEALQKLATVRAELDALKLAQRQAGEPTPPEYPNLANPAEPPPLRYVMVDRANDTVKRWLGPLHKALKARR